MELWSSGTDVDVKVDSKSSQLGAVSTWMGDLIGIPTEGFDFYSFFFFFFCFHFIDLFLYFLLLIFIAKMLLGLPVRGVCKNTGPSTQRARIPGKAHVVRSLFRHLCYSRFCTKRSTFVSDFLGY